MTFIEMLKTVLEESETSQRSFAESLGISSAFLSDLLHGNRGPSPRLINKICDYMGRGPKGRREWHIAGARTDGWEV